MCGKINIVLRASLLLTLAFALGVHVSARTLSVSAIVVSDSVVRAIDLRARHSVFIGNRMSSQLISIKFPLASTSILDNYKHNNSQLRKLSSLLSDSVYGDIDKIVIIGKSSPDGEMSNNRNLALQRIDQMRHYLSVYHPQLYSDNYVPIEVYNAADNGTTELLQALESDTSISYRRQIVDILKTHRGVASKIQFIKQMSNEGMPAYHLLEQAYFENMRSVDLFVVYKSRWQPDVEAVVDIRDTLPTSSEDHESVKILSTLNLDSPRLQKIIPKNSFDYSSQIDKSLSTKHPWFGLKTNLLYDLALAPNLALEVPLGDRWSVKGDFMFPWWLSCDGMRCMRILSGGIEGRYWLGDRSYPRNEKQRNTLTGHFLGLSTAGGIYDLQLHDRGHQGDFILVAGINYGYSWRLSRSFNMEATLGFGYLRANDKSFNAVQTPDNTVRLDFVEKSMFQWVGPTKIQLSITYLIGNKSH